MKKSDLKQIVAELDALGVSDSAEIHVMRSIDNALMNLQNLAFSVKGKDASYSIDASDHWAESVSEDAAVILKEV